MKRLKLSLMPILIAVIFLLSGASESGEPNPGSQKIRPDKHKTATQNVQKPTDNQPEKPTPFQTELIETLRAIAKQNKTAYEQGRADEKSWNSPSVLINIGLLIVGGIYTFFARRQWLAINKQAKIADDTLKTIERHAKIADDGLIETRRAADAATRAAKAAEDSNRQARETAHTELRAYALITDVQFSGSDFLDRRTGMVYPIGEAIVVTFRNCGRTPAYNFIAQGDSHLMEGGSEVRLPEDFSYTANPGKEPALFSKFTVSPDIPHPITFHINSDHVTKARERKHSMYVFGDAKYDDVFGNNHTTPFCFRFFVEGTGREGFLAYDQHNNPT